MKNTFKLSVLLAFMALLTTSISASPKGLKVTKHFPPVWEMLGKRVVTYAVDHDEILVTAHEGKFTAIKIKVKGAPLNMRKCIVHFGNGESHEIELRNNFQPGTESRVIDLPAGDRVINRIVFYYDTNNHAAKRALVEVWGRH